MPLVSIENVAPDVRIGLWQISENVDGLLGLCRDTSAMECLIGRYASDSRRREVIAVRLLLDALVGGNVTLHHEKTGKPYLSNGMNVSVSHTKGCASVIVSPCRLVAVDVEYVSERVGAVADRMLRHDENADTLLMKLLHWCAKETLYKLYSDDHLALQDIRVVSVDGDDHGGVMKTRNVQRCEALDVSYRVFGKFVLTYAVL